MVTDQHPKGDILPGLIGVMQTHIRKEGRRVWIRKRKGCVLVTLLRKLKLNQLTAARTNTCYSNIAETRDKRTKAWKRSESGPGYRATNVELAKCWVMTGFQLLLCLLSPVP